MFPTVFGLSKLHKLQNIYKKNILIAIKVCIPNLVDFEKFQTLPPQKKIVTTFCKFFLAKIFFFKYYQEN
jgi:hypothetical protein